MAVALESKPPSYWVLCFAIAEASNDSRETVWYGPWNIILRDLFHAFGRPGIFTVTYQQVPLVNEIDTFDSDEEESDEGGDYKAVLYPLPPIKYLLISSI